jgi:hypothetical protein
MCDNTHAGMRTYRHGQIAREKPVLQNAPVGDVDALALICHDDHCSTERHVSPEIHVSRHRQVVQLKNLRNLLEPLLELLDLRRERKKKRSGIAGVVKESEFSSG